MTYKKKLIEITITTVDGNTVTVTDTAEDQKASLALAEIKSGRFLNVEDSLIAVSAIVKVDITDLEDAEVERANPYFCEAESGGGGEGEVWYTGTLGECVDEWAEATLTETDKANSADLVTNPTNYSVAVNGIEQIVAVLAEGEAISFSDDTNDPSIKGMIHFEGGEFNGDVGIKCPTDITTVEVTVTHK